MSAPRSVAQMIPCATSAVLPDPWSFITLTGMIDTPGATPATPTPLLAVAAIVPATWVPWKWPSLRPSPRAPLRSTPGTKDPAKSTCRATPVSMTATMTPVPSARGHADSTSRRSSPQSSDRCGSLVSSGETGSSITRTSDSNSMAIRSPSACWRRISRDAARFVPFVMRSMTGRPFSTRTVTRFAASPASRSTRMSWGSASTDASATSQSSTNSGTTIAGGTTFATGAGAGATSGPALDPSAKAGEARLTERTRVAAMGREANRMEDMAPG